MRYFKLWVSFFKMSAMADFEYRLNVIVRVVGEFAWYLAQLSIFEVLYTHTDSISGWDVNDMRVFMATLFLTDGLYMMLFQEGINNIARLAKNGELDLYLTKPIDSQFMVSCKKVSAVYLINILFILGYLFWAVSGLKHDLTSVQILIYPIMVLCGLVIHFSIHFMFSTLSVVMQNAGNVQFVWYQFYRLATRPDPIYPLALRMIVLTALPMAFFASVPSRILVDGFDIVLLLSAIFLAVGTLCLSNILWTKALRHYSSASS